MNETENLQILCPPPGVAGFQTFFTGRVWAFGDNQDGRGWITVDDEEAWSFCTLRYYVERNKLVRGLRSANRGVDYRDSSQRPAYYESGEQAEAILEQRGVVGRLYFQQAVEQYPDLTLEQAMASDNLVHRALMVLDRRLGKRRLASLELRTDEHVLVRGLYRLRCEVEHLHTKERGTRSNNRMQLTRPAPLRDGWRRPRS